MSRGLGLRTSVVWMLFLLLVPRLTRSSLLPNTTLFRSRNDLHSPPHAPQPLVCDNESRIRVTYKCRLDVSVAACTLFYRILPAYRHSSHRSQLPAQSAARTATTCPRQ